MTWPPRTVIRRSSGLRTLESALYRSGLGPVAGVDEVGRGACAGPLVVAACVLGPNRLESMAALDDSKKLTAKTREELDSPLCQGIDLDALFDKLPEVLEADKGFAQLLD